jgi:hypothetical protein
MLEPCEIGKGPAAWRKLTTERLAEPLVAMLEEDRTESAICRQLVTVVNDISDASASSNAKAIRQYLAERLSLHGADRKDLVSLLREQCPSKDSDGDVLDRAVSERERDAEIAGRLDPDLAAITLGESLVRPLDFMMDALAFAESRERQIAWEVHVILPLAVQRLTATDLAWLGERMAKRRAVPASG